MVITLNKEIVEETLNMVNQSKKIEKFTGKNDRDLVIKNSKKGLILFKGSPNDLYRLYKDNKGVYHHYVGKKKDLKFKVKRWDRKIGMSIGHYPTSNFKIVK